jgi:hypothetical protein
MEETKYKIIEVVGKPEYEDEYDEFKKEQAKEMMFKYGLHSHFSLDEVMKAWQLYSDSLCAGWIIDNKESVESVFKVVLEEIDE